MIVFLFRGLLRCLDSNSDWELYNRYRKKIVGPIVQIYPQVHFCQCGSTSIYINANLSNYLGMQVSHVGHVFLHDPDNAQQCEALQAITVE